MSSPKKTFQRLPQDVKPTLYKVKLQPDLQEFSFTGWEEVTLQVISSTNKIVINAFDIAVKKVWLIDNGKEKIPEVVVNDVNEVVEFIFPYYILPGQYLLNIEFTGHLNDQLHGFYRNKYVHQNGEIRYAAGTHFEATSARRAYPCWDEPAIKAKFVFTLVVPKDRLALSNMPVDKEEPSQENSALKVVTFQTTPLMSTYLTAFIVGEYDHLEGVTSNGIPVRVFTPLGKQDHGQFALEVASKALSYYEWYFGIPYGLPKLDLITLSEFAIGAMENWGLITYRETALLVDPKNSSAFRKQVVSLIVAHELSHNWFGNLVTMEWWTDLWLKEGFATWIEYQCVDALYPEFNIWKQFIKAEQSRALELDALDSSHPVEVQVGSPSEIDEIFDEISYCKGACLIRMLQSFIGNENFRQGMKLYLNEHKFRNTNTKDMWAAMSKASGQNIGAVMDTWTKQTGFPLLKVKEIIDPSSTIRQVILTQEKLASQAPSSTGGASNHSWIVPYSLTSTNSPDVPVVKGLLENSNVKFEISNCSPNDWIRVNPGQVTFCHVQYEPDSLQRLVADLEKDLLSPENRIGLLIDLFALCRANYTSVVDVLKITEHFRSEKDFAVCSKLASGLSGLSPLVQHISEGSDQCFKNFMCKTFKKIGERLGWDDSDNDSHSTKLLREQVLIQLGLAKDQETIDEALRRFRDHCTGKSHLSANIKTPVYITVLTNGGKDVFDTLMKMHDLENSLEEKNRISKILGMVSDEHLIREVLAFSLSDKVRNQDTIGVLHGATHSLQGRQLVWNFIQDNWQELNRRYGSGTMLGKLIKISTDGVCCANRVKEIVAFFEVHEARSAQRAIQQGLEHIAANVSLVHHQGKILLDYLTSY
ncbi:unnamed protein product [Lymnaea stagnalis]|uniref:Aminopeptidase n=1 Tax=Lymnaea stagnalis TaxID=6523 RepID=A0AAV2HM17_LYMST